MTLEVAIALLEDLLVDDPHFEPDRRKEAINLGIEALKKVKAVREGKEWVGINPLLGETTD